ncbi:hypothetical protein OH76DRAFT_1476752 [Lentinus brumalis]|uniref:MYND-type domain-containing protein n=1 Tax=Lentinus brumalis TaxID=2498619 RepID=A0A371DXR2_9APHY|nr:hypothetical protein OH76DRAFT_1476752 [Polyporus brumalis]
MPSNPDDPIDPADIAADMHYVSQLTAHRQEKKRKHVVNHRCTSCGKVDRKNLRTCSICRAARYCNKECQTADYKGYHKRECADFIHPPFTTAFLTEPTGPIMYAPETVFARGTQDGIGCWVSVKGATSTVLSSLVQELPLPPPEEAHRVYAHCILTLKVLVQNRRKDRQNILVLAGNSHVVSTVESFSEIMKGHLEADPIHTFEDAHGETRALVGVAHGACEGRPRLHLDNYDGTDFAVIRIQFRVGDGSTLDLDWQAIGSLESFWLPCVSPWDGSDARGHDRRLQKCLKARTGTVVFPQGLCCSFDPRSMVAYYRDMIFKGTLAFVESHYGPTETEAWCRRREDILRRYGECGAAMKEVHGPQEIEAYKHFARIVGMGESTFAPLNIK